MAIQKEAVKFRHKHLLGIQSLSIPEVNYILDESMQFVDFNKREQKKLNILTGKTQINLFFESSTRTLSSFELAGKRLGAVLGRYVLDALRITAWWQRGFALGVAAHGIG